MGRIRLSVKTSFGELSVEGESVNEILELLKGSDQLLEKLSAILTTQLRPAVAPGLALEGVIEFTSEGPVIVAKKRMSQYEAIGLLLYAIEGGKATAGKLKRLLEASGMAKVQVPARLNEMAKRGLVFKPDPSKHDWKLTAQGERWIEEEVLPKLRGGGA
ncbi:MAG TPA: hypothetical protein ENG43_00285 [Candidatus Bathyarchaeota archaeon]|nr:hypothetical protein [Candidatus Bathyarchaeota archaeon]HEW89763.1 hypothetical protein [Candidatus Bathyarchaeota archaeon]